MGGGGSLHCAMSWPEKVKAVAPIHPAPGAPASLIYAPMMVPTGALDFVTSPMMVKASVFDGSPSPKIMPIMNGVAHREPVNYAGANRWNGYLTGFFTLCVVHSLLPLSPSLSLRPKKLFDLKRVESQRTEGICKRKIAD